MGGGGPTAPAAAINRLNLPRTPPFDGALSGNIWMARDLPRRRGNKSTPARHVDGDVARARLSF